MISAYQEAFIISRVQDNITSLQVPGEWVGTERSSVEWYLDTFAVVSMMKKKERQ